MKLNKLVTSLAVLGLASALATPAQAGYVVLDGWQLESSFGTVSPIGRLNLVSGTAAIEQEVNGSGNAFVGATFVETGNIYSLTYTKENVIGAGDSGAPLSFAPSLTISFANVGGVVTSLVGAGFKYNFTSGTYTISNGTDTAGGSIVGIGGSASQTSVIGGLNGDSTLLGTILASVGFTFKDNLGNSLMADMAAGNVLFEAVTNNNITGNTNFGACSFNANASCLMLSAASAGDAYLVRNVPEPGSLALFGLGLLGVGALRRQRASSKK